MTKGNPRAGEPAGVFPSSLVGHWWPHSSFRSRCAMSLPTARPANSSGVVPMHGYRGDLPPGRTTAPRGLTVALSREAGARGTTIARKLGELLGWQVFD